MKGGPIPGRPLEVNIPFSVDDPGDRACASANVRYGSARVARSTLHVQGRGLKRNLLVTSPVNVNEATVTVDVRVGCGPRAVTRQFILAAGTPAAKGSLIARAPLVKAVARQPAPRLALKAGPRGPALLPPGEPLFPPPASEPDPPHADASPSEELQQARAEAAHAVAQLAATRKELAAVLDVERRTQQTLIAADHQVRDAESEVARMRLVLKLIGAGLALVAAGLAWFEFDRVLFRMRTAGARPAQEPTFLPAGDTPA